LLILQIRSDILDSLNRITILIFLIYSVNLFAQKVDFPDHNIADCSGAIELQNTGNFYAQFTGKTGKLNDLFGYSYLSNFKETNSLFFKYTAPSNGKLSLSAKISEGKFDLLIFKTISENISDDIYYGKAKIENSTLKPVSEIRLNKDSLAQKDSMYINLKTDDVIVFFFNTEKGSQEFLNFSIQFEISDFLASTDKLKKIVDDRKNGQNSSIEIQIRDAETSLPVISNVTIIGNKKSNLYKGSDLIFSAEKIHQLSIICDATGYFLYENTVKIYPDSAKIIDIPLQSLSTGKKLKIDKLQFIKGTDQIFPSTESNLISIKDFLLLNAELKIEIQGHINNEGENDRSSKTLSRKRAEKIRDFFEACGVNEKRLTVKSFSNKFPIYPNPKNEKESQANRRVEIKIL
jgi:hypothetical protein